MNDTLLIIVHPGYTLNTYTKRGIADMKNEYGDYYSYLSNLKKEVFSRKNFSIVIPHECYTLPFRFPKGTEFITADSHIIQRMKDTDSEKIICGEFLWYYSLDNSRKLSGCVEFYRNIVLKDFPIGIRRDLCYPFKGPPKLETCV